MTISKSQYEMKLKVNLLSLERTLNPFLIYDSDSGFCLSGKCEF